MNRPAASLRFIEARLQRRRNLAFEDIVRFPEISDMAMAWEAFRRA